MYQKKTRLTPEERYREALRKKQQERESAEKQETAEPACCPACGVELVRYDDWFRCPECNSMG